MDDSVSDNNNCDDDDSDPNDNNKDDDDDDSDDDDNDRGDNVDNENTNKDDVPRLKVSSQRAAIIYCILIEVQISMQKLLETYSARFLLGSARSCFC